MIIVISWRDYNVCHIVIKFLFAHALTQRLRYTPKLLDIPIFKRVILLGDRPTLRCFDESSEKYHLGVAHSLIATQGKDFVTTRSIGNISNWNTCYEIGVLWESLASRFAFADRTIGENSGYQFFNALTLQTTVRIATTTAATRNRQNQSTVEIAVAPTIQSTTIRTIVSKG